MNHVVDDLLSIDPSGGCMPAPTVCSELLVNAAVAVSVSNFITARAALLTFKKSVRQSV